MNDLEHLKHMVAVRPDGPDKLAAAWAIAEIERLRAALQPFAEAAEDFEDRDENAWIDLLCSPGKLRRARAALEQ